MSSDDFDPMDMQELSIKFSRMMSDKDQGYMMEFSISRLQAKDMMIMWMKACLGDTSAQAQCFAEFGKIMLELEYAITNDERN